MRVIDYALSVNIHSVLHATMEIHIMPIGAKMYQQASDDAKTDDKTSDNKDGDTVEGEVVDK